VEKLMLIISEVSVYSEIGKRIYETKR